MFVDIESIIKLYVNMQVKIYSKCHINHKISFRKILLGKINTLGKLIVLSHFFGLRSVQHS